MNPQGDSAGQSNAKNENEVIPRSPSESLDVLPLFPLADEGERSVDSCPQPQQGDINNCPNTGVPLSVNPTTNAAPEHAMQRMAGGTSNTVHLPAKRSSPDHASGEFAEGESSNTGAQASLAKRRETESRVSHVSANNNNNVNPSPPPPVIQQAHQVFSEAEHTEPIQVGLYHSGATQHNLQPLGFRGRPSFITSTPSVVNTIGPRTIPHAIMPPCPHIRADAMAPLYGQGSPMFGQVETYGPNRSFDERHDVFVGRTSSINFPQRLEPLEPMPPLSGFVDDNDRIHNGQAIMFHPPSELAVPSNSRHSPGSRQMNYSGGASSSRTQNYHNQVQILGSGVPPFVNYEPSLPLPPYPFAEVRRRLPSDVQAILDALPLRSDRRTPMLEESMVHDYALVLHAFENLEDFDALRPPRPGLSVETIMQHLKREPFVSVVDTNAPEEDKDKCPICLEEFEDGDEIGKLHSCVHKFHAHCIKQWLMCKNFCPICKQIGLEINEAGPLAEVINIEDDSDNDNDNDNA